MPTSYTSPLLKSIPHFLNSFQWAGYFFPNVFLVGRDSHFEMGDFYYALNGHSTWEGKVFLLGHFEKGAEWARGEPKPDLCG